MSEREHEFERHDIEMGRAHRDGPQVHCAGSTVHFTFHNIYCYYKRERDEQITTHSTTQHNTTQQEGFGLFVSPGPRIL